MNFKEAAHYARNAQPVQCPQAPGIFVMADPTGSLIQFEDGQAYRGLSLGPEARESEEWALGYPEEPPFAVTSTRVPSPEEIEENPRLSQPEPAADRSGVQDNSGSRDAAVEAVVEPDPDPEHYHE